jgi:tryptophan synthase beta chain
MKGHFGEFGGRYVPELLIPALEELEKAYANARKDREFKKELEYYLQNFAGRPTPLTFAENLTRELGGARIYLKNEGLNHTGAHKITHCIGHALLAKRMKKKNIIAETGAGQHGLASAAVAAKFGLSCTVFMGAKDIARQRPNVFWMEKLGATVIPVNFGSSTLKDAVNAAIKYWMETVENSYYLLGSVVGPHPYPIMTRDFQSVVGKEARKQILKAESKLPDYVIACVGGGSNAIGIFSGFLNDKEVKLVGVEAGGIGNELGEHASKLKGGSLGVVEGYKSLFLQDEDGQICQTHSIAAGLDYAGIGPELAYLHSQRRIDLYSATNKEALDAFEMLSKKEGIFPALESAHAVAQAIKIAPTLSKDKVIIVNLSGRGDKDLFIVAKALGDEDFNEFLKTEYDRKA